MNEALRDWVANVDDTYYIIGTVAGPHPYPAMVRDFQSRDRRRDARADHGGRGPAARRAGRLRRRRLQRHGHVPSLPRRSGGRLIGVEAAGHGVGPASMPPRSPAGAPGVLHGNRTYLLQDEDGQIPMRIRSRPGSIIPASGPSMPGCTTAAASSIVPVTDDEALDAFRLLTPARGHHPGAGIGPRHRPCHQARAASSAKDQSWWSICRAAATRTSPPSWPAMESRGIDQTMSRIAARFAALKAEGRAGLVTFVTAGDPDAATIQTILDGLPAAGAESIELGMPFTDPMADGPAIQAAEPARAQGRHDAGQDARSGAPIPRPRRGHADRADGLFQSRSTPWAPRSSAPPPRRRAWTG